MNLSIFIAYTICTSRRHTRKDACTKDVETRDSFSSGTGRNAATCLQSPFLPQNKPFLLLQHASTFSDYSSFFLNVFTNLNNPELCKISICIEKIHVSSHCVLDSLLLSGFNKIYCSERIQGDLLTDENNNWLVTTKTTSTDYLFLVLVGCIQVFTKYRSKYCVVWFVKMYLSIGLRNYKT